MKTNLLAGLLVLSILSVSAAPAFAAKRPPITIQIVGTTSAKILVNGKEYVPGEAIPRGAKITVTGAATLIIGGVTVTTQGGDTKMSLAGNSLRVDAGQVSVTTSEGQTQTLSAGEKVAVNAPAPKNDAPPLVVVVTEEKKKDDAPPPPNPAQNCDATASPSAPCN